MTRCRYSPDAVLWYDFAMKVPPRLVPNASQPDALFGEQRHVPRFPLPKEQIKFLFEDGTYKVCAIRDLSANGVGISLLEHGEVLLFPLGQEYEAEIKLGTESISVRVIVRRVSAWSVGCEFLNADKVLLDKVTQFLNPMGIGKSFKKVSLDLNPEMAAYGLSAWYHGSSSTDLYFWNDTRGGIERALLCMGNQFWDWSLENKQRTGTLEREAADLMQLKFDSEPARETLHLAAKVLEHAEVLDYRLVSFLRDQMRN